MAYAIAGGFFAAWVGLVLLMLHNSRHDGFKSQLTRDGQRGFTQTRTAYDAARHSTREQVELMRGRW